MRKGCVFISRYNSSGLCQFNLCADYTAKNEKEITNYITKEYVKPFNGTYYDVYKFTYKDCKSKYLSRDINWNKEKK